MKLRTMALALVAAAIFGSGLAYGQAFAPNPTAQREFESWVNQHPELEANPNLINNPTYLAAHPAFAGFLKAHPFVNRQALDNGAWGPSHQWHNSNWWYQNNPNWVSQNRPNWVNNNPQWRNNGDWDEGHQWHNRQWWVENHRDWVEKHHPGWMAQANNHDGDWDENHQWHKRQWWMQHRREWARKHHPEWAEGENQYGQPKRHGHDHGHHND